jgi:hypothetical protein
MEISRKNLARVGSRALSVAERSKDPGDHRIDVPAGGAGAMIRACTQLAVQDSPSTRILRVPAVLRPFAHAGVGAAVVEGPAALPQADANTESATKVSLRMDLAAGNIKANAVLLCWPQFATSIAQDITIPPDFRQEDTPTIMSDRRSYEEN